MDDGVQLVSNAQLEEVLVEIGATEEQTADILEDYHVSRTIAFRAGIGLLIYTSLLGLVLTFRLPKRKLVAAVDNGDV